MDLTEKLKNYILKSPLAVSAREIESLILISKIDFLSKSSEIVNNETVYCISPYKTGTTYLSSTFDENIAEHEPLHYLSLKKLDENFESFFIKRLNYLNLKLECAGFWSAYVEELANNEFSKNLDYICILRPPSSWVSSVINYWNHPSQNFPFDIANELFWKAKVGVDLREYKIGEENYKNEEIIEKLIDFYFGFTRKTNLLKNISYVHLNKINQYIPKLSQKINERSQKEGQWKRKNRNKQFIFEDLSLDKEYELLVNEIAVRPN